MAAPTSQFTRRLPPPVLDPTHQRGLTALLSQTYSKPVSLNLIKLHRPHYDADILAQVVTQRLRDRRNQPRKVIRDAAWKAPMPSQTRLARQQQERLTREAASKPMTLAGLRHGGEGAKSVSEVVRDLHLSQVSSVMVGAAGRLSKRITANRADSKVAMRGATKKGREHYLRGVRKANTETAIRMGKRRIGQYGIRATVGYS